MCLLCQDSVRGCEAGRVGTHSLGHHDRADHAGAQVALLAGRHKVAASFHAVRFLIGTGAELDAWLCGV